MKNLILHIDQIKDKDLFLDFEEKPEAFPVLAQMVQKRECDFLDAVKVSLKAYRIRELFEVEGTLQTRVRLTCSRCLKEFDTSLKSDFALTYTKELPSHTEISAEQEIELRIEEIGLMYFRGEEINLHDGIQEQFVLAFPLQPLCNKACKGLCPRCGANLNEQDCGCKRDAINNKFAVLKDLKIDKKI